MKTEYRIFTTVNVWGKGETELPFLKVFESEKAALEFGEQFFEPPQTVLAWRVVEVGGVPVSIPRDA